MATRPRQSPSVTAGTCARCGPSRSRTRLGLLYSAFTQYAGFKPNSGEYKLMGLAAYGVPRYRDVIIDRLLRLTDDGWFQLDTTHFDFRRPVSTTASLAALLGHPARGPAEVLTQFHMDVAASIQAVTEEVMLRLTRRLAAEYEIPVLCLAGGIALNCVANSKILRDGAFKDVWVQPAAGDAGGALGAALFTWHLHGGRRRAGGARDSMRGSYLGPAFEQAEVERRLTAIGAQFEVLGDEDLLDATAQALADGLAVGWMQGRMEFGPRALGNRSILGDARSPSMQRDLNLKVKYRESFRPFAPSVLREDLANGSISTATAPTCCLLPI